MIIEAIATGKTVDDAVLAACRELGKEREDVEIEILELPKRGFLGLTHIPAKVRAYMEIADPAPAVKPQAKEKIQPPVEKKADSNDESRTRRNAPLKEKAAAPAEVVKETKEAAPQKEKEDLQDDRGNEIPMNQSGETALNYIKTMISLMKIDNVEITAVQYEKAVVIKVTGDGAGAVIGRRGETLDAMQYLCGLCANRCEGDYCRVIIDAGNYRQKRKQTLQQLAKRLANNAVKTGRSVTLEPMNPYERRIIHATVSEIAGAVSTSVGEEPQRCVVIGCEGSPMGSRGRGPRTNNNGQRRPYHNNDRKGGPRQGGNSQRREKPQPYKESSVRETAPSEASDQPLYGKIEL